MRGTVIQEALQYLIDFNDSLKEWCPDDAFIESKDRQKLHFLFHKTESKKWTPKMLHDGWKILEEYQDFLEDYKLNFDEIEKPDYSNETINEECSNLLLIENERFLLKNYTEDFKSEIKDEITRDGDDFIEFKIKLKNIHIIFDYYLKNLLQIDHQASRYINFYLNNISVDKMFHGISNYTENLNIDLKPFQEIGAMFLLFNQRAILADQMGLGKTVQSISAVEIADAYPCVIVCPATLKFNWQKEFKKITNKEAQVIKGKKTPNEKEVYIINYESVHNNVEFIKSLNPKSIIFDESHYLKNSESKRAQHCLEIINHVPYRFMLAGTAVVNRPLELIPQLKILRRLEQHFESEDYFIEKFCFSNNNNFGRDHLGAQNLELLSSKLKEGFFLRRLKKDVEKELPNKERRIIEVDVNQNKEYEKKINEFLALSKEQKVSHIASLRQNVAQTKIEKIKKFSEELTNKGNKVVIFAYHRSIQKQLADSFPNCAQVLSEDDVEKNINRFKDDPECNVIVCSLKIGSVGLNLTNSCHVIFCEMDWCPSINSQAEDRVHRMGQEYNVFCWYFIVQNSIDAHLWKICEKKRDIIERIYQETDDSITMEHLYSELISDVIDSFEKDTSKTKEQKISITDNSFKSAN